MAHDVIVFKHHLANGWRDDSALDVIARALAAVTRRSKDTVCAYCCPGNRYSHVRRRAIIG
jgi:hypothetical protein